MCSYFTHFADDAEAEAAQRARQIRYYKDGDPALPAIPRRRRPAIAISSTWSTGWER